MISRLILVRDSHQNVRLKNILKLIVNYGRLVQIKINDVLELISWTPATKRHNKNFSLPQVLVIIPENVWYIQGNFILIFTDLKDRNNAKHELQRFDKITNKD